MFLSTSSCTLVIRSRGIVEMVRATEGRGALSVSTPSMFLPLSSCNGRDQSNRRD